LRQKFCASRPVCLFHNNSTTTAVVVSVQTSFFHIKSTHFASLIRPALANFASLCVIVYSHQSTDMSVIKNHMIFTSLLVVVHHSSSSSNKKISQKFKVFFFSTRLVFFAAAAASAIDAIL
jgi:hypothetical protein